MTTDPNSGPASSASDSSTGSSEATGTDSPSRGNSGQAFGSAARGSARDADLHNSLEAEISAALGDMSVEDLLEEKPRPKAPGGQGGGGNRGGRQLRTGRVFRIHGGDVFVEFGPRSQGVCPLAQFPEPPAVGSDLEFVVERLDAFEGLLVLSRPGAVQKADWGNLEIGQVVEARCIGMNKGGLEMEVAHHKGFMPAGMVDLRHIPDISVFIGEKFPCEIVELNKDKNRLILSRKAVLVSERAEKRDELLAQLEVGQIRPATIISIQPYGAFADLGGVDGLIHISDLSHERIKHPSETVKEGEIVQVKIKKIDRDQEPVKISLSRKDTMNDPLAQALTSFNVGDTVTGKVTRLAEFGAFVELAPGVEGLVHISEVSHERIPTVDKVLKRDEVITCKILQVDPGKKRISLSLKALQSAPERPGRPGRPGQDSDRNSPREEDPGMRKLKARMGGKSNQPELKGGLG
ncbi:MAG: S1 RNA-binding domain-containing protein [Phycisphaerae bacterium]|jgi:ribosomal protein S1|nr:S1 RNA-binding domain-containing protein [Phycisphaerae bacterium]